MIKTIINFAVLFLIACSPATKVSEKDVEIAIQKSENYSLHKKAFVKATKYLVEDGQCSINELTEQGGWMKSVINHKDKPVYFTYCGGMKRSNRLYLNVETHQIFKD